MEAVSFKGIKDGIQAILAEDAAFDTLFDALRQKLASEEQLLGQNAGLEIFSGSRRFDTYEAGQLAGMIKSLGHRVLRFVPEALGVPEPPEEKEEPVPDAGGALLIRRNIRSGQNISYEGPVVVLGDVNPGAMITSGSAVVVIGALRGTVHAGYPESEDAWVYASQLKAMQIRIGRLAARAPDEEGSKSELRPEIALVKAGRIIIEEY